MAFLEFGNVSGLAYRHDWDKDIDTMYRGQQMVDNAKKESQQMSMMIGEKLKFGQAYSDYDSNELKSFTDNTLKDISKMFRQNPNLLNSPTGWAMFNQKADSLVNNDITRKSLQYKQDKEKFQKLIEENPDAARDPEIMQMAQQFENYNKYGSADGISANRIMPKFYRPDLEFSVDKAAAELAKSVKRESEFMTVGGYDVEKKYASEENLNAAAASAVAGKDGYKWKKQFEMLSDTDKSLYGYDGKNMDAALRKFVTENIKARVETDYEKLGESFEMWKAKENYRLANDLRLAKAKQKTETQEVPYNIFKSTFLETQPGFHTVGTDVTQYISPAYRNVDGKPMINLKAGEAMSINIQSQTDPNAKQFKPLALQGSYQYEEGPEFYKSDNGELYSMGNVVVDYKKEFQGLLNSLADKPEKQQEIQNLIDKKTKELRQKHGNVNIQVDDKEPGVFRIPVAVKFDVTAKSSIAAQTKMSKDYFGAKMAETVYGAEMNNIKTQDYVSKMESAYNLYKKQDPSVTKEEFFDAYVRNNPFR